MLAIKYILLCDFTYYFFLSHPLLDGSFLKGVILLSQFLRPKLPSPEPPPLILFSTFFQNVLRVSLQPLRHGNLLPLSTLQVWLYRLYVGLDLMALLSRWLRGWQQKTFIFLLSLSWMLLAAKPVRMPLSSPSGILIPLLLHVFLRGNVSPRLFLSSSRRTFYAGSRTVLMCGSFFNLLRDTLRGKVLIRPYPLVGPSLTPFHINLSRSSFLTLFLTVCHLGLSPYGVRSVTAFLHIWLCLWLLNPPKPRLGNDNRFLNLWIRDVPFKLDSLAGLPRYVFPSSFQSVCDDKSGYDHVLLSPESRPYFGFEWGGWYFTSNTIPFGWKASAYIYHSIGLLASPYFHSLRIPCSLYIDDRQKLPPLASLSSDRHKSLAHANSAIFLVCFTLINLGYFIGIKKSILILSQIVPFLGFLVDSLLSRKNRNSFPFCVMFFTPTLLL